MGETTPRCLFCHRDSTETPLVALLYNNTDLYICPQHLPVLIHEPAKLIGKLPGADKLKPADHND